jgi:urea transporter
VTDDVNITANEIDWLLVGRGIAVSMSQVYGVNDIVTSAVMNVAVLIASPLLFATSTLGAAIGCLLGKIIKLSSFCAKMYIQFFEGLALLPVVDYVDIYDGIWGYNALLTMAAISCVFYSFNERSALLGVLATIATTVAQFALKKNMVDQVRKINIFPIHPFNRLYLSRQYYIFLHRQPCLPAPL